MNNCKYPLTALSIMGLSLLLQTPAQAWGTHFFTINPYADIDKWDKLVTSEHIDSPNVSVSQENNEMVVKLKASGINVEDVHIEVKEQHMSVKVPANKSVITLELNNDHYAQVGVMVVDAHVKTVEEKKDDKGVVLSKTSGVAHVRQTQMLPSLIGNLHNVKAEYKDDFLILHIPGQETKKINVVKVWPDPGLK